MRRVLVTGGAGFIGSHLVDALMTGEHHVTVIDDLSAGKSSNLDSWLANPQFSYVRFDLLHPPFPNVLESHDIVYHLAANPDVRAGTDDPRLHFDQNIRATYNLLEEIRRRDPETLVFTSSSTVYGEPDRVPTPEDYSPLKPVSVYGATKLACESLISAYAATYGFRAAVFRLANVTGPRSDHGVVPDLVRKLLHDKEQLSMHGDGTQDKSYVHVTDCVRALIMGIRLARQVCEIFNLGSEDRINVRTIADIVCQEMDMAHVRYHFHSSTGDGRGWPGDVRTMQLDISKLKQAGWTPAMNSAQTVRRTVNEILSEQQLVRAGRAL